MNKLDIVGYYLTKFTHIELKVIYAIMDKKLLTKYENFDTTTKEGRIELKQCLTKSELFEERDIEILTTKIKKN
jgi:peroxiredoxin family protein